jgi:hypothetical protein
MSSDQKEAGMEYHTTEQVDGRRWEQEQSSVVEEIRRRAQHDLAAQHPGSTITINAVHHSLHPQPADALSSESTSAYLVDFVVDYTLGGEPNPLAA